MEGMNSPPDFARIDRLVEEYTSYRQKTEKLSADDIVERVMKYFDSGDYPNILYMWDNHVSLMLEAADPHDVHEANVSEFYMHIHCATCPFRQSFIRDMPNPGAAAKIAARSMTIFKHYVETKGKTLAGTPEFHEYKHLPKIAFPPTHPKYQHLFYQDWITRTRDSFFKFLIPFVKERTYPALCYALSNQHKLDSSEKSPNTLLQRARDKEKRTAKLAKALFESASEFVDMIAEDGSATKNSVDEIQRKLTEFGKLLLPHSPEDSHTHLPENSVSSVFSEIDTTGQKKKKKTKKKKSHYDFSLIGVDLSSMIVELSTELQKHLHENSQGGTASLSIDLEMATQSALQGCLLMKALRQIASAEDSAKDLSTATIPEVQEAPSPRSKGGIVDKMVYNMTQGDLFGVAKSGDADNGLVTNTSLPFEALLKAYTAATAYISTLPVVEEPDEEVLAVSREDKMLIDTLKVSRFFVEDYISLVAVICTSASGVLYVTDNSNGIGLYSNIIQFLLDLKPKKEDMMVKLHVVCLCTMISIGHKVPACLEVFIQKGGIQWLAATMDGLFSLDSEVAQNLPEHEDYVDLCMGLLHLIVRNSQCRKLLFITPDDLASTVTIACQLVNCIAADASKALNGHKVNRSSATPPADILIYLVDSNELRSAVRSSSEVASLRDLFTAYENNEHTAAKLVAVKSVLNIIDATDPNHNTVVSSVSDLVYSVGVRNLVFDMLDGLKESTEVANYRDENPSYETTNLILEKYKLNSVV